MAGWPDQSFELVVLQCTASTGLHHSSAFPVGLLISQAQSVDEVSCLDEGRCTGPEGSLYATAQSLGLCKVSCCF
jgi:hypothetical protein